jgi:hypothetical protein
MTALQQSNSTRRSSITTYLAHDTAYGLGSFSESNSFSGPSSPGLTRRSSLTGEYIPLGSVSLHIDNALEFGVFMHIASNASSASFQPSSLPDLAVVVGQGIGRIGLRLRLLRVNKDIS